MTTLVMSVALNQIVKDCPCFSGFLPEIINSGKFVFAFDRVRIVNSVTYVGVLYPNWKITKWITNHPSLKR